MCPQTRNFLFATKLLPPLKLVSVPHKDLLNHPSVQSSPTPASCTFNINILKGDISHAKLQHRMQTWSTTALWYTIPIRARLMYRERSRENFKMGTVSGGQWGTEKMRGKRLSFSSRPACVGLSRTLMEFPACLGAICICPTRLMSTLLLIFESDLPTAKHEFWPIYILLQRSRTSFSLIHPNRINIRVDTYSFPCLHINTSTYWFILTSPL